jgi:hypothetical protein
VKRSLRVAISIILTALFLALFLRGFDLGAAWRSLTEASPALIALSVAINLLGYVVRAWRWRVLLAPVRPGLGMYNLTSTTFIGFMISFLVPFRLGEVVRPVLLARRERLSAGAALATIALERVLDALAVMGLFLLFVLSSRGALLLAAPPPGAGPSQGALLLRQGLWAAAIFAGLGVAAVGFLVAFPRRVLGLLRRLAPGGTGGPAARLLELSERFIGGLGIVRHGRGLAQAVALSFALWLVIDLGVLYGVRAFGLPLALPDIFLLMVPLAVGIAVPTPGGVGPYEFLAQVSLTDFWGVEASAAAAAAVTLHAITLLPTIALGMLFMWRDGLRPGDVRALATAGAAAGGGAGAPPGGPGAPPAREGLR